MLLQTSQNQAEVVAVCSRVRRGDEEIVDIGEAELEPMQHLVDEPLERLGRISQAERHSDELEKTERSGDGSLRHVGGCDRNLVIRADQIQFGEDSATM